MPAFAALIFALARFEQRSATRSGNTGIARFFVDLGESSCGLFLAQWVPLIGFDSPAGKAWLGHTLNPTSPAPIWWRLIGLTALGARLLHELVEKPARRALLRDGPRPAGATA